MREDGCDACKGFYEVKEEGHAETSGDWEMA